MQALHVGSVALALVAALMLILSVLAAIEERRTLAALWLLTAGAALVIAWGMRRVARR